MCIGNSQNCPLLSWDEQRAQHNFEERKGPYPSALADRLEREGIMPAYLHWWFSVLERNTDLLKKVNRGDCPDEETAWIEGRRHTPPSTDEYLLPSNQRRLTDHLNNHRYLRFMGKLQSKTPSAHLLAYPEASQWMVMISSSKLSDLTSFALSEELLTCPEKFAHLLARVDENSLRRACVGILRALRTRFPDQAMATGWLDLTTKGLPHLLQHIADPVIQLELESLETESKILQMMPRKTKRQHKAYAAAKKVFVKKLRVFSQDRLGSGEIRRLLVDNFYAYLKAAIDSMYPERNLAA